MEYSTLNYSILTKSKAIILVPYIDNNKNEWYKYYKGYHSGLDITADTSSKQDMNAYSFSSGVVIQVGEDEDGTYSVTIQYDVVNSLRYMHIKKVNVSEGDIISIGDEVGTYNRYFHFEYVSTNKGDSIWYVRVGTITYYKHNPELVLNGEILLDNGIEDIVLYENEFEAVLNGEILLGSIYD